MPKQALLDYSMSILINDSEDNIKSLLHRGLYPYSVTGGKF